MNYLAQLARSRAAALFTRVRGRKKPPYVPGEGVGAPRPTNEVIEMYSKVTYRRYTDGSLRKIDPERVTVKANTGAARGI